MTDSIIDDDTRSVKDFPARIERGQLMSIEEFKRQFSMSSRTFGRWKRAVWEAKQRDFVRQMGTKEGWILTDDIFLVMELAELPPYEPEYKWKGK